LKAEIAIGTTGVVLALLFISLGILAKLPWPEAGPLAATSIGTATIILAVEMEVKRRKGAVSLKIRGIMLTPYWYTGIDGYEDVKGYMGEVEVTNKGTKIAYNLTAEIGVARVMGYYVEVLEPTMMDNVKKNGNEGRVDIEDIHKDHASKVDYEWIDENKETCGSVFEKLRQGDLVYLSFPKGSPRHVGWGQVHPRSLLIVSGREHSVVITVKAEDSEKNTVSETREFKFTGKAEDDASTIFLE